MAQVVGFNQAVADAALAGKADTQRKAQSKKDSLHISFRKGASLDNNPFASALKGVRV
jgi:hypothetical protein